MASTRARNRGIVWLRIRITGAKAASSTGLNTRGGTNKNTASAQARAALQRWPTWKLAEGACVCCNRRRPVCRLRALLSLQEAEDSAHGKEDQDDRNRHPDSSPGPSPTVAAAPGAAVFTRAAIAG